MSKILSVLLFLLCHYFEWTASGRDCRKLTLTSIGLICEDKTGSWIVLNAIAPDSELNEKLYEVGGMVWLSDNYGEPNTDVPWTGYKDETVQKEYVYRTVEGKIAGKGKMSFEFYRFGVTKDHEVMATTVYDMEIFKWEGQPLKWNYGPDWTKVDKIKKMGLGKLQAQAIESYRKSLLQILDHQNQNKLLLYDMKNSLAHPFHVRPHNTWILVKKQKDYPKYYIPLFPNKKGYEFDDKTNTIKYLYLNQAEGHIKFSFSNKDKLDRKLVTIELDSGYKYNIYWFQQVKGQCVLHSLHAILQERAYKKIKYCGEFQKWANTVDNKWGSQKCPGCTRPTPIKSSKHDINEKQRKQNDYCPGSFSKCAVERYLISYGGYSLLSLHRDFFKDKSLKEWREEIEEMMKANSNYQPIALWLSTENEVTSHSQVFRYIKPIQISSNSKPKLQSQPIWVDLNSGDTPKSVDIPDAVEHLNVVKINRAYLVYEGHPKFNSRKLWKESLKKKATTIKKKAMTEDYISDYIDYDYDYDNDLESESINIDDEIYYENIEYYLPLIMLCVMYIMVFIFTFICGCASVLLYGSFIKNEKNENNYGNNENDDNV